MSKDANYFNFVENEEWEVLTPTGFQYFKGIASSKNENLIKIKFSDGSDIVVTSGHEFISSSGHITANNLIVGGTVFSESGESAITEIEAFVELREMFDFVEVGNGNVYYTGQKLSKNCILIDEVAFIQEHIWEDFYNSVYPTISSGKTSKIIMVSTPKGMNHFFNIYNDAARNKSSFYAVKIPWWERPDRDEKWKEDQLKNMSQIQFNQEFGCKFLGSSNTLVDSDTIERMIHETPVEFKYSGALQIFEPPQENAFYVLGVDSGKGSQSDYSVTQVLKINADKDIEQVAIYRSNTIDVHDYAVVVDDISKYYNNAFMMVESNDIGEVVCDVLWNDLECDRLINYDKKGLGIRSTRKTKLAGNLLLKKYIENGWLTIKDSATIYELSIYEEISPNVFHAAGQNDHDDCVTSLVWAVFYLTSTFYDPENNTGDVKKLDSRFSNEVDNMLMYDNDGFFDPNANKIGDMRFDDNWSSQNNFW
jgi:hypothetical protein